jgi:hypothetical protein
MNIDWGKDVQFFTFTWNMYFFAMTDFPAHILMTIVFLNCVIMKYERNDTKSLIGEPKPARVLLLLR